MGQSECQRAARSRPGRDRTSDAGFARSVSRGPLGVALVGQYLERPVLKHCATPVQRWGAAPAPVTAAALALGTRGFTHGQASHARTVLDSATKEALRKTVRGLHESLLASLDQAAESEYRLQTTREKASLSAASRGRLEEWMDQQVRATPAPERKSKATEKALRERFEGWRPRRSSR